MSDGSGLQTATDTSTSSMETSVHQPIAATQSEDGEPLFQAPGWIEPDPFTTLVSSLIPGTVAKVNVREGERVTSGQVVAELDDGDAKVAVRIAEANLLTKQAELDAAQSNWENPISLDETIKTAQAETSRLEAEKLKVQRQLEFSKKQADISRTLGLRGADSALASDKAALEAGVAEAELKEIDAKIVSQVATLEAATRRSKLRIEDKSRLNLAKAQIEEAAAALDEAKLRLSRCSVVAPTSGTIMRLYAFPGSMVSMDVQNGTHIVSMYDPAHLQARAEVPQGEAGKIQVGLPAEIRLEAMPDKVFRGELSRIVHEADVQRNSLPVKVRILDPDPAMKPEMVVRLQFKAASHRATGGVKPSDEPLAPKSATSSASAVFVPAALLMQDAKAETNIWVVGPDMRAHRKLVILGPNRRGDLREVKSGIQLSDKLVASKAAKLKEGARVRIVAEELERQS
ncbi:MAG: efflux RND transporter periplasmic adaptor subunit [Candidatus Sumerlaeaceae bacterium]